jgi:hypothetical protein
MAFVKPLFQTAHHDVTKEVWHAMKPIFEVNAVVWARVTGYPDWPARVRSVSASVPQGEIFRFYTRTPWRQTILVSFMTVFMGRLEIV